MKFFVVPLLFINTEENSLALLISGAFLFKEINYMLLAFLSFIAIIIWEGKVIPVLDFFF